MKPYFNNKYILHLFTLTVALLSASNNVSAQVITQNQPLDFGRFVIVDNAAVRTLEIRTDCMASPDPEFMLITDVQCGNYTVSGYPPFTPLTVTFVDTNLNNGPVPFTLTSLATVPTSITTDATGEVTFNVRAQLRSDGTGGSYIDGAYSGNFTIIVTP